jgi:hypothetical protein
MTTTPEQIDQLDAELDGDANAANAAVQACAGLTAPDRASWAGFFAAWQGVHQTWQDERAAMAAGGGGAKVIAEFGGLLDDTYATMRGFDPVLTDWERRIAAACPAYVPPPAHPVPVPPPPSGPGAVADWATLVKWGVIGAFLLIGYHEFVGARRALRG